MLQALLPAALFTVLLIFVRVGSAMLLLPGFGETYVSARVRLLLALTISFVLAPVLQDSLPVQPERVSVLLLLLLGELTVGLFIGTTARIMLAALTTAGMVMANMSMLANALINDPAAQQQGSLAGAFLNLLALVMIFALDLHHLMLTALIDSYALFTPGEMPPIGDFSQVISETVARSFTIAIQMAAPFIAAGMTLFLAMGLLARLMPQVQIFFVVMPLQVSLGIVMLLITLPIAMSWFLGAFEDTFLAFTR